MKLLKIDESNNAYFSKDNEWVPIVSIERDDLLSLIDRLAVEEIVELDECNNALYIADPTARLIYKNIYNALKDLSDNRDDYLRSYKAEFEKLEKSYGLNTLDDVEEPGV